MRLDQLKLLLFLERYGTLSAVSKELNMTQSTISYNLKELEKELETALFTHEGNRLRFTPKGRRLIPHIENIEQVKKNIFNIAKRTLANNILSGNMLIGYDSHSCGKFLVEALIQLKKDVPGLTASMFRAEYNTVIEKISYKEFNAGVIQTNSLNEVEILNLILSHSLNHQILFSENMFFVAGEQHPLCRNEHCALAELMRYQFITSKKFSENLYTKFLQKNGNDKPILFIPDYQSQHNLLEQCNYITLMPYTAYHETVIKHKYKLKIINVDDFVCKSNYRLLSNNNQQTSTEQEMLTALCHSMQTVLAEKQ